jgi:ActR/RegA family two-component response regulator
MNDLQQTKRDNAQRIKVLLVDDEESFLEYTTRFLGQSEIDCDTCRTTTQCLERLQQEKYDVLVSDIQMPDNSNLQFIKQLSNGNFALPIIVVTGYPSVETAIEAVNLSVFSYLLKPVEPNELLNQIRSAFVQGRLFQLLKGADGRLKHWMADINTIEKTMSESRGKGAPVPADSFLGLTFGNIIGSLADLSHFIDAILQGTQKKFACSLLNCPRLKEQIEVIQHSIQVLDKTKRSFKSKELGELRKHLEMFIGVDRD